MSHRGGTWVYHPRCKHTVRYSFVMDEQTKEVYEDMPCGTCCAAIMDARERGEELVIGESKLLKDIYDWEPSGTTVEILMG